MIKIDKRGEPSGWAALRRKHPGLRYGNLEKAPEGTAARIELRRALVEEQLHLCCYCCGHIDETKAHNEHIRPRDKYPEESMDYRNIVASCESPTSCGKKKSNEFDEGLFVSPLEPDCENHFVYYEDGEIVGLDERGKYTIDLLHLNSYQLRQARRATYEGCKQMSGENYQYIVDYYLKPNDGPLPPYVNIIRYFDRQHYFNIDEKG